MLPHVSFKYIALFLTISSLHKQKSLKKKEIINCNIIAYNMTSNCRRVRCGTGHVRMILGDHQILLRLLCWVRYFVALVKNKCKVTFNIYIELR